MCAFPLESIKNDANATDDQTRVEQGFIGAHTDIGGGFENNDLSKVALAWMLQQVENAGVKMQKTSLTIAANPVIHDKSDNQYSTKGAPVAPGAEDRTVHYRDGKTTRQMAMIGAGMAWTDTQKYISYLPADGPFIDGEVTRVPRADYVTGTVDMKGYLEWLNKNGYDIKLTVEGS